VTVPRTGPGVTTAAQPDDLVVLVVRTAKALVERVRAEHSHEHPHSALTVVHGLAARYLADHDDVTTVELARYLRITKQSTSEVVAQLENAGIVRRTPHPRDGRARVVSLTEEGEAKLLEGRCRFAGIEDEWAALVGREQLEVVRDALSAFLDADEEGATFAP
jgi:DNA-binding MarR family transcriptional regulator